MRQFISPDESIYVCSQTSVNIIGLCHDNAAALRWWRIAGDKVFQPSGWITEAGYRCIPVNDIRQQTSKMSNMAVRCQ